MPFAGLVLAAELFCVWHLLFETWSLLLLLGWAKLCHAVMVPVAGSQNLEPFGSLSKTIIRFVVLMTVITFLLKF